MTANCFLDMAERWLEALQDGPGVSLINSMSLCYVPKIQLKFYHADPPNQRVEGGRSAALCMFKSYRFYLENIQLISSSQAL